MLDRRVAAARQHAGERGVPAIGDDQAVSREGAHEMVELRFDRGEIGEDVGVVELEVVQYRRARRIVQELGALVEERGVVLVRLHDEVLAGQARGYSEIVRNASYQEA